MTAFLAFPLSGAQAEDDLPLVRIGIVIDGGADADVPHMLRVREQFFTAITEEILTLTRQEFDVRFPSEKQLSGEWTSAGIKHALDELLDDPEVDLVLAFGPLSTSEACRRTILSKPVIAPFLIDLEAQQAPFDGEASGLRNLNYITIPLSLKQQIERFREIVDFETVHFIFDELISDIAPEVKARTLQLTEAAGAHGVAIPLSATAGPALAALPQDAEAVFILPLPRLGQDETRRLIQGINERKIPSLSWFGAELLREGALMALAEETNLPRLARRVALNVQRTLLGEDPGTLPVILEQESRLTINMATAREIGWYPSWDLITEAKLINEEREDISVSWTLDQVAHEALRVNQDLKVGERELAAGEQDVREARAALLPQLSLEALGLVVDEDRAAGSFGQHAERTLSGSLSFNQLLYSDAARGNVRIQDYLQSARENEFEQARLDVVLEATTSFLNVLRAQTLERIRRENLRLTEDNLRIAQRRQELGVTGPSEVYRWESQRADDRRELLQSSRQLDVARSILNRILNRPVEERFTAAAPDLLDPNLRTGRGPLEPYVNNPWTFEQFRDFMVREGLDASPELKGLDEAIAAQERVLLSARRSYWSPTVALFGDLTNRLSRSGEGSDPASAPPGTVLPNDTDWNVGVQLSLPLISGGARKADVRRGSETLAALRRARESTREKIELRIRASLFQIAASSPAIDLSAQAADAARRNLDLVRDSYERGVVSILDLLDAQNAALVSDQVAANAVYDFLIDLMEVQRAAVNFDFFLSAEDRMAWFEQLKRHFASEGNPL
jgi:outer membrane protein TolC